MKKVVLSIDGMTCSACSNGLEKYLNKQDGIEYAVVNLVMANTTIKYDEKKLDINKIEEFIKKAGFKSLGEFKQIDLNKKKKSNKILFVSYTILAILLMYISMGYMINLPTIPLLDIHQNSVNYMFALLIISTLFLIYGFDIIKNGYKNLIHRTPNMDTLVGIGVLTSFLYSLYNMCTVLNGDHEKIMFLYFESSAIVIYFIKLGRYIDGLSKDKTKEAISKLVTITPNKATVKINRELKEVTLDEIKKGDIVVCKPGEKIAVDGIIVNGKVHIDESFITGESKPRLKEINDRVIAGSINYDGYIEYTAERIGKESTVSEIVKLVVEASNIKAPIAKIADKVSGYFVPIVIGLAILTFLSYLLIGESIPNAITTFVTILVVACPCSLGLATPLAIIVSEGLCATNGILVKKSEILENAKKTNTVIFDKTGTLTYGKLKISEIINYSNMDDSKLMQLAGSIENKSTHPIAKAFIEYSKENNISLLEIEDFENIAGMGIVANVNNEKIIVGSNKIIDKYNIKNNCKVDKNLTENGNSIVYIAKENSVLGLIGVNDIIRDESVEIIKSLNDMNIETIMLTGDNNEAAERTANKIGIKKVISDVLPKDKANTIKELKNDNRFVIMCGDGINDSIALAYSDIGISVNDGADITMDSADVILTKNDLNCITNLINISKKTVRIIKQNLFWAFFYNCLMIPVAIGLLKPIGISINPMIASLAMVLSSITVILNTLRLRKIKV